jgi:hypothetical protein
MKRRSLLIGHTIDITIAANTLATHVHPPLPPTNATPLTEKTANRPLPSAVRLRLAGPSTSTTTPTAMSKCSNRQITHPNVSQFTSVSGYFYNGIRLPINAVVCNLYLSQLHTAAVTSSSTPYSPHVYRHLFVYLSVLSRHQLSISPITRQSTGYYHFTPFVCCIRTLPTSTTFNISIDIQPTTLK